VLPSLPVDHQDDFTSFLVHLSDAVGNQGSHKLLACAHGYVLTPQRTARRQQSSVRHCCPVA
jgi:hypothetical protein